MRSVFRPAHLRALLLAVLTLLMAQAAFAGEAKKEAPHKRGILLVAFGTSVPEATAAIDALKAQAEQAFPGVPVRLAYSSHIIRTKIAEGGVKRSSPAQALADMAAEGFSDVAVQSLHTIPGQEFGDIKATAEAFQAMPKGIRRISVGRPLLHTPEDIAATATALLAALPRHSGGEAVLLMGHGTAHPANAAYSALQLALWKHDRAVFVGTVEGVPSLEDILPLLKARGVRTAHLVPLMSVAGDHAQNDMAGPEEDSWASRLRKAGIASRPVLVGLGSRPAVAALWIDHLKDACKELGF